MARCFALASSPLTLGAFLLFLLAITSADAQTQEWIRGVGGPGSDYGRFVEPTSDGGFAVAGTRTATASSITEQFWVARFSANGTLLWQKTYGRTDVTHTIFTFSSTRDGGFMIGGFTGQQFSGAESAIMFRIDSVGKELWKYDINYSSSDHWHLLIERREGGYYFGGHTDSKGDERGDVWLQRLDDERNVLWEKTYDRGTGEHAHAGIETRDGGVLMLGHTEESNYEKYWLVKVDSNGTKQWDKVLSSGPAAHDSPYDLFETREGTYALIGGTSGSPTPDASQGWLLIVDSLGNTVTDKHFGNPEGSSFSWGGRQTSDGGFIVAGHTNYRTHGNFDMYIVKTDSAGDVEWESAYGGVNYEYGFDVVEADGGYIGVGVTASSSIVTGGSDDLLLVKINEDLALPAAVVPVSPANHASTPLTVDLIWTPIEVATRYHVQLATDAAFSSLVIDDSTRTTTSATTGVLLPTEKYWWRVRAASEDGWGPYSPAWDFQPVVLTSAPDDGLAVGAALTVTPNPATDGAMIAIDLAGAGVIRLALVDARGAVVATLVDGSLPQGRHALPLETDGLAAGTYSLRLSRDGAILASSRMTIVH
jgi:hypothetical protein